MTTGGILEDEECEEVYVERLTPPELVEYARYGDPALVRELCEQGLQERLAACDERGNTMLHMFAANGLTECIALFLERAPLEVRQQTLDRQNAEGNTPLHWACIAGQHEAVRILRAAGAQVAIENKAARTPICEAHKHQRINILAFFEETLGSKADSSAEGIVAQASNISLEDR